MNNSITGKNKKIATGWLIVIACMLVQAIPNGIVMNTQSLYMYPVMQAKGFTLSQFSLIFTIGTIVPAIIGPFIGGIYRKVNTKILYLIGGVLLSCGFMTFSIAEKLWQFYAIAAVVQVGASIVSGIGVPILLNSWFDKTSKGKAMGIAYAGGSIGNVFLQQLVVGTISSRGYAHSYFVFGLVALAAIIPIALFMIRMPKNESEIVRGKVQEKEEKTTSVDISYTLKEAQKNKYFWIMGIGLFFVGIYVSAYSIQYAAYFQGELKLSPSTIATTGSLFALASLFGNLVGGILFDKLGAVKTLSIGALAVIGSGVALLMAGTSPLFAHVHSILKGLAMFVYMMTPAYMVGAFFGNKEYGSILGLINLNFALGFCSGSALFGVFVEKFGYNVTWMGILVCVVIAFTSLIIVAKGMTKANKERMERLKDKNSAEIA
ncbi:conjugated bile salt MFS transporter [Romboutsia timonensis]|uniref:conjugated bile salt MFS transporter n=1 Tax=Romboutsia timonensis TaxID=1776391 RepID=UPI0023F884E3|nr:conjugated bile salt MFS transporter [Romboutsia timonensis]